MMCPWIVPDVISTCWGKQGSLLCRFLGEMLHSPSRIRRHFLLGNVMICISFSSKCDRREGAVRKAEMSKLTNYYQGRKTKGGQRGRRPPRTEPPQHVFCIFIIIINKNDQCTGHIKYKTFYLWIGLVNIEQH